MATLAGIILCLGLVLLVLYLIGLMAAILSGRLFRRIWRLAWGDDAKCKPPEKDVS